MRLQINALHHRTTDTTGHEFKIFEILHSDGADTTTDTTGHPEADPHKFKIFEILHSDGAAHKQQHFHQELLSSRVSAKP
jgi:hypothetical protein